MGYLGHAMIPLNKKTYKLIPFIVLFDKGIKQGYIRLEKRFSSYFPVLCP
jgi:hypothetical protein